MKKVLCIEDNSEMADVIADSLCDCEVIRAGQLSTAREMVNTAHVDLITLDLSLPDGDGMRFLDELIRSPVSRDIPVIVLTARKEIEIKVLAFTIGAEDFIQKPFDTMELKIRVESKLRRLDKLKEKNENIRYGDLQLNISKHKVWLGKESVSSKELNFTSLEFKLLLTFMNSPERVLSRNYLLNEVWGDSLNVTDRTVDTHIGHLRKKINGSSAQIFTVIGEGYKLALQ